jgi:carbamoyl-phosphate synthase small subunit
MSTIDSRYKKPAVLALEDGSVFRGFAFGGVATAVGEAVFNTSMTGYQEVLTDPSYFGQVVAMTAPQIGNYGVNPDDEESDGPKVRGFVVRDLSPVASSWRSCESLTDYLARHAIPAISGVDTRTLTKKLRLNGAMQCCLSTEGLSDAEALSAARNWEGLVGMDYVREVSAKQMAPWDAVSFPGTPFTVEGTNLSPETPPRPRYRVAAIDLGAKRTIFRKLAHHGFEVTIVPASTPPEAIRELRPDGVFLSNGPGDPSAVPYVHRTVATLLREFPTFGICMGNQMLTHALGAQTFKLKFGHRGGNQPVKNLETGKVSITSQNHGFAARREDLENRGAIVTEINLNDGTVEGIRHRDFPVFSVQYHPEASPGPHDSDPLFSTFYDMVARHASA